VTGLGHRRVFFFPAPAAIRGLHEVLWLLVAQSSRGGDPFVDAKPLILWSLMAKVARMPHRDRADENGASADGGNASTPAQLARSAASGDLQAAQTLLRMVTPALTRAVYSVMGPRRTDAEDVVQQALIAFVQALPSFRGECHPTSYAARIAVRAALASQKRTRSQQTRLEVFAELSELRRAAPDSPIDELQADGRRGLVRDLLSELPTEQAETLALHVVVGMSLKDVAVATSAPLNTVKSRLRLAKKALRGRIEANPSLAEELGVGG